MQAALDRVVEQVRQAAAAGERLRIRGGASKSFLSRPSHGPVLDTRGLAGVTAYEPSELVVTAGAGTPLAQLESLLAQQGQCLPFEPPHFGTGATVGGMVAAGLAGPARLASGGVRDYVLGVRLLNGRAEHLRFGGQVMKNVAGYDVSRLMAGAWGALGVLTEVSLKVLPRPPAEATLIQACGQEHALERLNRWAGQPIGLNASVWEPGADARAGRLVLRLRGARAAVTAASDLIGGEPMPPQDAAAFWQSVREQDHPAFAPSPGECLWRLSVPDTAPALALPAPARLVLMEWGGAVRWIRAGAAQGPALRALAASAGGTAWVFRDGELADAAGLARRHPLPATTAAIERRLRLAFDPHGVFQADPEP